MGDALSLDRQDHDVLVHHMVVLDVRAQGERRHPGIGVEEHRRAGHPNDWKIACIEVSDESVQGPFLEATVDCHDLASLAPCHEHHEDDGGDHQG